MSRAEERGKIYALHKASEKLNDYYSNAMLSVVQFDGYDIKNAYIDGCHQAEKDLSDQARKAVEIAREEIYEWLKDNIHMYNGECEGDRTAIIEDLKQAMKNE